MCAIDSSRIDGIATGHPGPLVGGRSVFPEVVQKAAVTVDIISGSAELPEITAGVYPGIAGITAAGFIRGRSCSNCSIDAALIDAVVAFDPFPFIRLSMQAGGRKG